MSDILTLLDRIRERPGMFVQTNSYVQQYRDLEVLIIGYELAMANHQISEAGTHFLKEFGEFLRSRYGWSMACGPFFAIQSECSNHELAWERFWELYDDYRSSRDI